jgi:8-hydroxy-5-deazaflavin:NADPH oxidoreductase
MKIGVLGTGMVGTALATRLAAAGHEVRMGAREATNESATKWASGRKNASNGTFEDAARFGEIVVNATGGTVSLEVLKQAGAKNLAGKVLIDVANPLDFSKGYPRLSVCNDDSLGEQIQRAYPEARVVKALNTLNADLMLDPNGLGTTDHALFMAGDDAAAKSTVRELLQSFGWKQIHDVGGISGARGMEMMLIGWLGAMKAVGNARFNWKVVTPA